MITLWLIGVLIKICFGLLLLPIWMITLPFRMIGRLFGGRPAKRRTPTYEDGLWEGLIISSLWD